MHTLKQVVLLCVTVVASSQTVTRVTTLDPQTADSQGSVVDTAAHPGGASSVVDAHGGTVYFATDGIDENNIDLGLIERTEALRESAAYMQQIRVRAAQMQESKVYIEQLKQQKKNSQIQQIQPKHETQKRRKQKEAPPQQALAIPSRFVSTQAASNALAAFAEQSNTHLKASSTPLTSAIARRIAKVQRKQGDRVKNILGLPFVAEAAGGPPGFSSSAGGSAGTIALGGHSPLLVVANYQSPGQQQSDLLTNPCALGFSVVGRVYGATLSEARGSSFSTTTHLSRSKPTILEGILEQPDMGGAVFADGSPYSVNGRRIGTSKRSNISPDDNVTSFPQDPFATELASHGRELWGKVIKGARKGEINAVVANGKKQYDISVATLPSDGRVDVTEEFKRLMAAVMAQMGFPVGEFQPDFGLAGVRVYLYKIGSRRLLVVPMEHFANVLYGTTPAANPLRYFQRSIAIGVALAQMESGTSATPTSGFIDTVQKSSSRFVALSASEFGQGGYRVIGPMRDALAAEAASVAAHAKQDFAAEDKFKLEAIEFRKLEAAARDVKSNDSKRAGVRCGDARTRACSFFRTL